VVKNELVYPEASLVRVGQHTIFTCISSNDMVEWLKYGLPVWKGITGDGDSEGQHTLVLGPVMPDDVGIYQCRGKISEFSFFEARAELLVLR